MFIFIMRKLFIYCYGVTKIVLNIARIGWYIHIQGEAGSDRSDIGRAGRTAGQVHARTYVRTLGIRYSVYVTLARQVYPVCICCTYDIISARYRLLTTTVCNCPHMLCIISCIRIILCKCRWDDLSNFIEYWH